MSQQDHEDLEVYLEELIRQAMRVRYSYEWFMKSEYMKLCDETLAELLCMDALEAGL